MKCTGKVYSRPKPFAGAAIPNSQKDKTLSTELGSGAKRYPIKDMFRAWEMPYEAGPNPAPFQNTEDFLENSYDKNFIKDLTKD